MLARRVAVAADDVLLAARERAADRSPRPLRELGCEQEVVAEPVLGAEAAAHELADHTHLVLRQAELRGQVAAEAPDVLRRHVDVEAVAPPLADALVCLERVVVQRLRCVLGLDDRVRLGEPALVVTALVVDRLLEQRAARDGLVRVEQRLEHLPFDLDELRRGARLCERLRGDAGDGAALEVHVLVDPPDLAGADDREHAGCRRRCAEVDPLDVRPGVRAPHEGAFEHPGELDVARVARLAASLLVAVDPRRVPADDRSGTGRPLDERVLLDERPHLLVAALDLLLRADQPCHEPIASSIRG